MSNHTEGRSGRHDPILARVLAVAASLCLPLRASALDTAKPPGHLLVADVDAEKLYAYQLSDLSLTGQLEGIKVGAHAGTLVLPDGRILLTDEKNGEVLAIELDDEGVPHIAKRVAAKLGAGAAWATSDRDFKHFAVAAEADETSGTVNIIDLESFENTPITVTPATEEVHPFLANKWLVLSAGSGAQVFSFEQVLADEPVEPSTVLPIGSGSHGPVVSYDLQRGYISTEEGLDGFDFSASELQPLESVIPWSAGDPAATGQNYRPRLSWDGVFVYGAITAATPEEPERWAERTVDVHVADLLNETAKRVPLTTGIVSRFQLARTLALFANITDHGDFVQLFDVVRGSPTFQQVVGEVELAPLHDGPVAGEDPANKQARSAAITPDGRFGFVSHGGDGVISVIDTAHRKVTETIETPSPLKGGGYLVAVQAGVVPTDTTAR